MRLTSWLPLAAWLLLVSAAADLVALKRGILTHPAAVLVGLFGGAMVAFSWRLVMVLGALLRRRRVAAVAETVVLCGVLLGTGGGMANWLLRLQGTVVLTEREMVPLQDGLALQAFDAGPLARLEEMGLSLALEELELKPAGESGFYPASRLRVWRRGGEPVTLEVTPRQWGSADPLRFHQGAFGFAPRIVFLRDGREVFDRVVPFLSRRESAAGVSFEGDFSVEAEGLDVKGNVNLASLDEGMRGHAGLVLTIHRDGEPLGRGQLLPGHFATLDQGFRVGFAGLGKWSEILVSRHNYGTLVVLGAAVAGMGGLLWPVAAWRGW